MKKVYFLTILLLLLLTACQNIKVEEDVNYTEEKNDEIIVVDYLGNEVVFKEKPKKVVALGYSVTEVWLLSNGELVGITSDSLDKLQREDIINVGTVNNPNVEEIMKTNAELVLMSSSISGQREIEKVLKDAGIQVLFCDINSFDEYLYILEIFTKINGTENLYEEYGTKVNLEIEKYKEQVETMENTTGLFLRASSVSLKALSDEKFSVKIIEDLGIESIADESLLEDLSIETILQKDPYYIFLVIMGNDEEVGVDMYKSYINENPALNTLTAVKENRVILLPKELFHNKPNNRWDEAYEYIYNIRKSNE